MAEAVSNATSVNSDKDITEQRIKEHAQKYFSLSPDKVDLGEMKADPMLPETREFYLQAKNISDGKQYTYLLRNNQLYCSGIDDDFGRFLKDYGLLQKKELDSNWFLNVVLKLNDFRDMLVIDEQRINNPQEQLKPFLSKISIPTLDRTNNGGATFTFFTQSPIVRPVQKHEIKVAPDYIVSFNRNFVTP